MTVRPVILFSLLLLMYSASSFGTDAKIAALLNVNPTMLPGDPGYIDEDLIKLDRANLFTDLVYRLIEPAKDSAKSKTKMPLVIMLHGCGQTGQSFVESTKIHAHAKKSNFLILAPEQSRMRNFFNCWSFYDNSNRDAGALGELNEIIDMIKKTMKDYPIDPDRVYVTGISAGAGMANNLAITHPELIKGVAVSASPSYAYSPDGKTLNWMMMNTAGLSKDPSPDNPMMRPDASSQMTREKLENITKKKYGMKSGGNRPRLQKVLIFHGEHDPMVDADFLDVTRKQYENAMSKIDKQTHKETKRVVTENKGSYQYSRTQYSKGSTVESFLVEDMWHSWGGGDGRTFTSPKHVDQTEIMLKAFGLDISSNKATNKGCLSLLQELL